MPTSKLLNIQKTLSFFQSVLLLRQNPNAPAFELQPKAKASLETHRGALFLTVCPACSVRWLEDGIQGSGWAFHYPCLQRQCG